jgi:alkylation response protein AidB-like acyl-CoA dehydrogenase
MEVDLDAARLLVLRAGHLKNQGRPTLLKPPSQKLRLRGGGSSNWRRGPDFRSRWVFRRSVGRTYYRDAKVATIYEGTSQSQQPIIGSYLMGMKAFT